MDQRAPYASTTGYWNGTVWMPHQWFIWKASFGHGRGELAHRTAAKGREVWSDEIAQSGRCCEQFDAITGKGSDWHPFGALSSPVVRWYAAYHRPGRLKFGLDARIVTQQWNVTFTGLQAQLALAPARAQTVLATFTQYPRRVPRNGKPVPRTRRSPGRIKRELQGAGQLVVA